MAWGHSICRYSGYQKKFLSIHPSGNFLNQTKHSLWHNLKSPPKGLILTVFGPWNRLFRQWWQSEVKVCWVLETLTLLIFKVNCNLRTHYNDVIMTTMSSQITSLTVVYSIVSSGADQRKHQSSASLAFVRGIHRGPVNSPHKWPVTRKKFPFDDVIM